MANNEPRLIREAPQPDTQPQQLQVDLYSVIGQKEVENGLLRGELQKTQQVVGAMSKTLAQLQAEIDALKTGKAGDGVADEGEVPNDGVHADVGAEGADDKPEGPADVPVVEQLEDKAGE